MTDWLPLLMTFSEYDQTWPAYLDGLYGAFHADFVASKPSYPGKRMGLKRYPLEQGKEATFWHFISQGRDEATRTPDMRRCERIRWPRPIIDATQSECVRVWQTKRGRAKRIVIALVDFSYVVVLDDRGEYVLPWTAYCVEREHRRVKLKKEYEAWRKGYPKS